MEHSFFFDGNSKRIAWIIQTKNSKIEQKRKPADIYLDKVSILQSKYIAMHVGLFWGIGRFIINNEDSITIKIDVQTMFDHFSKNLKSSDELINTRTLFIEQLIDQRKLKINYKLIDSEKNFVSKLL